MSFVKEELDVRVDEQSLKSRNPNKTTYLNENDDSQEEDDIDSQKSLTYTGKNAKAKLSDKLTFRLIKEYECRPCLWQKDNEGNKNFTQKQKAFDEIAQSLNLSSDLVKEKLRTLRVIFFQNVKKTDSMLKRGDHGFQPRWRFYEALTFLSANPQKTVIENAKNPLVTEYVQPPKDTTMRDISSETVVDSIGTMDNEDCSASSISYDNDDQSAWIPRSKAKRTTDDFGKYVSLTLAQIDDEIILNRAKCQIQLVLSAAITEHSKKYLSIMSTVNGKKRR